MNFTFPAWALAAASPRWPSTARPASRWQGAPSARPTRARSGQTRLPSDVTYRVSRYNVISERDDGTMTAPPTASSTAAQAEINLPAYMLGMQATDAAASVGSRIVGRIRYRSIIILVVNIRIANIKI